MSERTVDLALAAISRARNPWPSVYVPTRICCDNEPVADVVMDEDPREVERALGRFRFAVGVDLDGTACLFSICRATPRDLRGMWIPPTPDAYVIKMFMPHRVDAVCSAGWRGEWIARRGSDGALVRGATGMLRYAGGMLMAQRYRWQARFLHGNGHVVIDADPRGALDLFRSRDAMPGERRKALLHLVRGHRRRTTDGESDVEVRRHLRGIRSFIWNGWQVRLSESDYEREQFAGEKAS